MREVINPQKELDRFLETGSGQAKKLCLHSCCAPCSSYCLLYLSAYFEITVFYYNPNISVESEYKKRAAQQQRLIEELNRYAENADGPKSPDPSQAERIAALMEGRHPRLSEWIGQRLSLKRCQISYHEGEYEPGQFFSIARGLENEPERGLRCMACYELRLKETAAYARDRGGFDYFASTLTLSPLKDAAAVNRIGSRLAAEYKVPYLPTDFKKKNGYLLSIMLSELFGLYRQNYCGCVYSQRNVISAPDGGK